MAHDLAADEGLVWPAHRRRLHRPSERLAAHSGGQVAAGAGTPPAPVRGRGARYGRVGRRDGWWCIVEGPRRGRRIARGLLARLQPQALGRGQSRRAAGALAADEGPVWNRVSLPPASLIRTLAVAARDNGCGRWNWPPGVTPREAPARPLGCGPPRSEAATLTMGGVERRVGGAMSLRARENSRFPDRNISNGCILNFTGKLKMEIPDTASTRF